MIRVLIAEDSLTCRDLLIEIIAADSTMLVIGHAANGEQAVSMAHELRPDVIVMDVHMPLLDGFEATRRIMREVPTPIVIVSATVNVREVAVSMHALSVGALAVLPKPGLGMEADFADRAREFTTSIRSMAQVRVVRRWEPVTPSLPPLQRPAPRPISVVAIAASTGGPGALHRVLSELPAELNVPILVVQHIAVGFVEGLTAWLDSTSPLRVCVARHGERIKPGNVYVAPDEGHLGLLDRDTLAISHTPPIGGFRPSATFMFDAVARAYSARCLAVVLTGMGDDGLAGLRQVHEVGGRIIAQDEQSSVVFGMPGAVVSAGLAEATLPLDQMAHWLRECLADAAQ